MTYHPGHGVRRPHGTSRWGCYCRRSLRSTWTSRSCSRSPSRGSRFFEDAFGYPYPFHKYDQLFVPEYNMGAMENAGAVTLRDEYLFRAAASTRRSTSAARETVLHELAHMWFGDLVTMRWWDDLWLNESFAEWACYHAGRRGDRVTRRLDDVRQRPQELGLRAGPAALHAPDRRRHTRLAGGRGELRRHHLRQGRLGAQAAGRLRRAGELPRRAAGRTSASTRSATPSSADLLDPLSRMPPAATSTPGPSSGCGPAGVNTLRAAFELDADGALHLASPSSRPPPSSTRCCAATGWPSGSTTT